jgi:hypothetical protein
MDPIRPIGPRERDVEPVVRIKRSSPDGRRERPDEHEGEQPRRHPEPETPAAAPPDQESGSSLIDVRV